MRRREAPSLFAARAAVVVTLATFLPSLAPAAPVAGGDVADLPPSLLAFEPNLGQADPAVRYLAHVGDGLLLLTETSALLVAPRFPGDAPGPEAIPFRIPGVTPQPTGLDVLRLTFEGASPSAVVGVGALPGRSHYLVGERSGWVTDVPHVPRVEYRDAWRGIDVVFRGAPGGPEFDLLVAAGADLDSARVRIDGATSMEVDAAGDLALRLPGGGSARITAPVAWQEATAGRIPVEAAYDLRSDGSVGFRVPERDPSLPLVVDPLLVYGRYLGGSGTELTFGASAVDSTGAAFVTGLTTSTDFPVQNPFQETYPGGFVAFVSKVGALGYLDYSTYLGGQNVLPYQLTFGQAVAADADGSAYVVGWTNAPTFPVSLPTQATMLGGGDAFVTVLSAGGNSLRFSTFLGGTGGEIGYGIAAKADGTAFVAVGSTSSWDFPVLNAYQGTKPPGSPGFVTRWTVDRGSGAASYVHSTYFGGGVAFTSPQAVAIGPDGAAHVVGLTGHGLPVLNAFQPAPGSTNPLHMDGFVAKFDSSGALSYSSYLGGRGLDFATSVVASARGTTFVGGLTGSADFPFLHGYFGTGSGVFDGFLTEVGFDGTGLVYSSGVGGSDNDGVFAVALDGQQYPLVAGYTWSRDNYMPNSAQLVGIGAGLSTDPTKVQDRNAGLADAFVMRFDAANRHRPIWGTYYGGSQLDVATGLGVDALGNAVIVGYTSSTNLPTDVLGGRAAGRGDAFVAKLTVV